MIPPQIERWVKETYKKPQIAEYWLSDCCDWVAESHGVDPEADSETFIRHVEYQFLSSSLHSSTVQNTGLPEGITDALNTRLQGTPILIEVISITEIGSSAFHLSNVRQTRIEREDLAGLAQQEGDEAAAEEEGPIPNFPRQMLKFQVTDGTHIVPAIEYRRIPQFQLGETPLGLKILLKNVLVRRGILFLEPEGIEVKDPKFRTEELDEWRDFDFLNDLRRRMGRDELRYVERNEDEENGPLQPPAPPATNAPREVWSAQPQREVSEPPIERLTSNSRQPSSSSTLVPSRYFGSPETATDTLPTGHSISSRSATVTRTNDAHMDQLSRILSPVRGGIIDIDSSTDTIEVQEQFRAVGKGKARATAVGRTRPRTPQSDYDFGSDSIDWEELERIEQQALDTHIRASSSAVERPHAHVGTTAVANKVVGTREIIMIGDEDDEDEFDKENKSSFTKHRKKRENRSLLDSGEDVIEISD